MIPAPAFRNIYKAAFSAAGKARRIFSAVLCIHEMCIRDRAGYEVFYIGSYDGMEKRLMADFDVPYYGISTGKFRRYFDLKNFTDPFRVIKGCSEARKLLKPVSYTHL